MEVSEAQKKLAQLEKDVENLFSKFHKETGLRVVGLNLMLRQSHPEYDAGVGINVSF